MAIPAYYSLIQRGSSGPDVALVQTWLNGIRDSCTWHAALTVDGKFGANAEKAVREFQLRYGLKEDGKVGAPARTTSSRGAVRPSHHSTNRNRTIYSPQTRSFSAGVSYPPQADRQSPG